MAFGAMRISAGGLTTTGAPSRAPSTPSAGARPAPPVSRKLANVVALAQRTIVPPSIVQTAIQRAVIRPAVIATVRPSTTAGAPPKIDFVRPRPGTAPAFFSSPEAGPPQSAIVDAPAEILPAYGGDAERWVDVPSAPAPLYERAAAPSPTWVEPAADERLAPETVEQVKSWYPVAGLVLAGAAVAYLLSKAAKR